jgi:hypothetical protein
LWLRLDLPPRGRRFYGVRRLGLWSALLSIALGCGGEFIENGVDTGSADGSKGDSPIERDTSSNDAAPTSWSPVCPASAPAESSSCTHNNLYCEYGCGNVLVCAGTWGSIVVSGASPFCQDGGNSPGCPPAISSVDVDGGGCTDPSGGACVYSTGICECFGPYGGTPYDAGSSWWCGPGPGCPMPRPRIGSPCSSEGQSCAYAEYGSTETCMGGSWQYGDEPCGGG